MKTVLLIEDDTALRENTAELLELSNYKVVTAPNGRVGIEAAFSERPDIVVCDIMMPEIDGYQVLETLSNDPRTKWVPFIFLSAKTEHKEIRLGMDMGADDYLTKPFEEEELLSAIESRLAKTTLLKSYANGDSGDATPSNGNDEFRTLHELKNHFDDHGEVTDYSKGQHIYEEGARCNNIYLILGGLVKTYRMDENGKELITALYKEDDLLGFTSFLDNTAYEENATALEDTQLAGISKNQLKDILEANSHVALELMELLTDNLSDVKDQLLQMAYSSVRKKTAQTILQFVSVLNKKPDQPIKISRNDLASVAGIAPESLIRTLSGFKKEGLIEIEGRNIRILRPLDLESIE